MSEQKPAGDTMTRSVWSVSSITMLSRILGLARDYLLIFLFARARWVTDAFLFAFTIPNLFRRLFGEGALSAAFIPVFVKTRENDGDESASTLASSILSMLVLVTGGFAALGMMLCFGGNLLLAPGEKIGMTLRLTGIMLPFLCLICTAALLAGMLQSLRCFALPAAMSVLLNLCFLGSFGYVYFYMADGNLARLQAVDAIQVVAAAVVVAGMLQLLILLPAVIGKGVRLVPSFSFEHPGVRETLKALGPTALGLGVVQVNVLIDSLIAYAISMQAGGEGANTFLYLGNRMMQLPLGVFGIAVATTAFPYFARHAAKEEYKELVHRLERSVRLVVFVMLPAGVGLVMMADPIVRFLFQRQDLVFDHVAVYRTSAALGCYAGGLVFFSLQHLLTRVFYARRNYRTPIRIAIWMVGVNLVLNLLLIHAPDLYRHWDTAFYARWCVSETLFPGGAAMGEAGLALATSITALVNVLLLWYYLRKDLSSRIGVEQWEKISDTMYVRILWMLIATCLMGVFVYFARNSIPYEPELLGLAERALAPIVCGVVGYYILCLVIPIAELDEFVKRKKPQ